MLNGKQSAILKSERIAGTNGTEEDLVKVPKTWKAGTLQDVISSVRGGFSVQCEDRPVDESELGVLKTGAVLEGRFDPKQNKYVPPEEHARLRTPVSAHTIIICRNNSAESIGASAIVERDYRGLFLSDLLWELKPSEDTDCHWLSSVLQSDSVRSIVRLWSTGTQSTMKNISQDRLLAIPVCIPTQKEQQEIVAVLRTWDEAIDKLEALFQAKLQRRDGIAQRLLASTQLIGKIKAKGWKIRTLGEVFTERQDRNYGLTSESVVTVGKYAIRKQSEHFTRSVASSDLSSYWLISPGDFVYDPMSAYYGALGQYTGDADGIVSPAYRVIRLTEAVLPIFMVYLLKSRRIKFLLETRSSQGNREGKRRLLQRDEFANIDFLMPPPEEQCRIANILSAFERDLESTATLIDKMRRQKRGLMQKLLTGEWRVNC